MIIIKDTTNKNSNTIKTDIKIKVYWIQRWIEQMDYEGLGTIEISKDQLINIKELLQNAKNLIESNEVNNFTIKCNKCGKDVDFKNLYEESLRLKNYNGFELTFECDNELDGLKCDCGNKLIFR